MNKPTYHRYKKTRFWAVTEADGTLIAVTVYKKGAQAIIQRLSVQYGYSLTEQGKQALEDAQKGDPTPC